MDFLLIIQFYNEALIKKIEGIRTSIFLNL